MNEFDLLSRWAEWLRTIRDDVRSLLIGEQVFWSIQKIVSANQSIQQAPGLFTRWIAANHAVSTAVGIRRQRDKDERSVSLEKLLRDIERALADYPQILSRESFAKNYCPDMRFAADAEYDRIVGNGATLIRPSFIKT